MIPTELVSSDYFTIYVNPDNSLHSGHDDGVGYIGETVESSWVEVRDALNKHYKLTTFSPDEMNMVKSALKPYFLRDSDGNIFGTPFGDRPTNMPQTDWKAFLDKLS